MKVSQEIIDRGIPAAACNCPIAIALNKTVGNKEDRLIVNISMISDYENGRRIIIHPNDRNRVGDFILRFDRRMGVKPISFLIKHGEEIRAPEFDDR